MVKVTIKYLFFYAFLKTHHLMLVLCNRIKFIALQLLLHPHSPLMHCIALKLHSSANKVVRGFQKTPPSSSSSSSSSDPYSPKPREYESNRGNLTKKMRTWDECCNQLMFKNRYCHAHQRQLSPLLDLINCLQHLLVIDCIQHLLTSVAIRGLI